jgi:hypothetical protein
MDAPVTRLAGLVVSVVYAGLIVWVYGQQPRTMAQVTGGMAAGLGAYDIDRASFDEGLRFFRNDQFVEARAALTRADPAERDPETQFYIAYSFYRQGWGRLSHDDALYRQGLEVLDRAVGLAPGGRIMVADETLGLRTSDELRVELVRGLTREPSDLNPLKVLRPRP